MGNGCANDHPLLPFPAYLTSSRLLSYPLFSSAVNGGVGFFAKLHSKSCAKTRILGNKEHCGPEKCEHCD